MDNIADGRRVVGRRVAILEDGEEFKGLVQSFDPYRGCLGLVLDSDKLQLFYKRDVDEVKFLDEEAIEEEVNALGKFKERLEYVSVKDFRTCHSCNKEGHLAIECPNVENNLESLVCHSCNRTGHIAKRCPEKEDVQCNFCNQIGHFARSCPNAHEARCHCCGKSGHLARSCPEKVCFKCNSRGHLASICTQDTSPVAQKAHILSEEKTKPNDESTPKNRETPLDEEDLTRIFRDLKPEREVFSCRMNRTDNRHVKNLHKLDMTKLLGKSPPDVTETMEKLKDSNGFEVYQLPVPRTTSRPRFDVNGNELNTSYTQKVIRGSLWTHKDVPPALETPQWLYIIEEIGDLFEMFVEKVRQQSLIGLSLQGVSLGRSGLLSWVVISTIEDVFMIDIATLGNDALKYGLGSILQDPEIIKIMHDCRQSADILHHQYKINLENVWDTLAGDLVFANQHIFSGFVPKFGRCLGGLLRDYLGVEDKDIFYPRQRRTHLDEDSSIWMQRPLPPHLLIGAARTALYLPELYNIVKKASMFSFHQMTDVLINCVAEKEDDYEAEKLSFRTDTLPTRALQSLPDWSFDSKMIEENGGHISGGEIYQYVGNPDPGLIYGKDSLHMGTQPIPEFVPLKTV